MHIFFSRVEKDTIFKRETPRVVIIFRLSDSKIIIRG